MIPRIKKIKVLDDFILYVEFDDGYKVLYDVKDDIKTLPSFKALVDVANLFAHVHLDTVEPVYIGMIKLILQVTVYMNMVKLHNTVFTSLTKYRP